MGREKGEREREREMQRGEEEKEEEIKKAELGLLEDQGTACCACGVEAPHCRVLEGRGQTCQDANYLLLHDQLVYCVSCPLGSFML